jgi:hypothetical protein
VCFKWVEGWNVPTLAPRASAVRLIGETLTIFQTFGTVVSTEMKHTHNIFFRNKKSKGLQIKEVLCSFYLSAPRIVIARRALFPTILAPYASTVSNLPHNWGLLRAKRALAMTEN